MHFSKTIRLIAALLLAVTLFGSCGQAVGQETQDETETEMTTENETETEATPLNVFEFDGSVSEETLRAYLSRAVTISGTLNNTKKHIESFILDIGAKYICRAATCWDPSASDYDTYNGQRLFIQSVHKKDPDVVFEACLFECVSKKGVGSIKVPDWVFEAFGQPVEDRNFRWEDMIFLDGSYKDQWGTDKTVPDMTRLETKMFFYYRACSYIKLGYEAFHMGQVYLMGRDDKKREHYTQLTKMIRAYAKENARRHFVFLNAHVQGMVDTDGVLMFDFHMWPSRLYTGNLTDDGDMDAYVKLNYLDSIYGGSSGGKTQSGWTCKHLPYLVELDNFGDSEKPGEQKRGTHYVWGYDEISWFANQSDEYRHDFLEMIVDQVRSVDSNGYFAMPGERVARIYNDEGKIVSWTYYAYDKSIYDKGFGDQQVIKEVFASRAIGD